MTAIDKRKEFKEMHQELVDLIITTAGELGEEEVGDTSDWTAETPLFGDNGVLDSMGLVTLVVAVEQSIEDRYDTQAGLADEKAMSQARSPYRTVASLAEYAEAQIKGA